MMCIGFLCFLFIILILTNRLFLKRGPKGQCKLMPSLGFRHCHAVVNYSKNLKLLGQIP